MKTMIMKIRAIFIKELNKLMMVKMIHKRMEKAQIKEETVPKVKVRKTMKIVTACKKADEGSHSDDKQAQNSEPKSKLLERGAR